MSVDLHPDHFSHHGAKTLAARLQAFWHGHGYPAAEFTVIDDRTKNGSLPCVRSNLIGGIPPVLRPQRVSAPVPAPPTA